MARWWSLAPLLLVGLSGCLLVPPGWLTDDEPQDDVDDDDDRDDDDDDDEPVTTDPSGLRLYPSGAARGQTVVASLVAEATATLDLATITEIELYGPSDVKIHALQLRSPTELMVVMEVDEAAALGVNDLHVFVRGGDLWINDAFTVVARPGQAPDDFYVPEGDPTDPGDTADTADSDLGGDTDDTDVAP